MRSIIFVLAVVAAAGCAERYSSTLHDAGMTFTPIGEACAPDTATTSQCGYKPRFYCTPSGICASACNTTEDCPTGASCVGAGDMVAGECRLRATDAQK
jgi:hypothetical protein